MAQNGKLAADVFVVGGGPAGLAVAILAARNGLRALVADYARPPIDKACGEGLMPDALEALGSLGVELNSDAVRFSGIRFLHHGMAAQAGFHQGSGVGIRRTVLHERLVDCATRLGVRFAWGSRVTATGNGEFRCNGRKIQSQWVVGADGRNSLVRRLVSPQTPHGEQIRFGSRRHYHLAPWTEFVEIYWGRNCQVTVTPTGTEQTCVAVVSRRRRIRVPEALEEIPELARRFAGVPTLSSERGAVSGLRSLAVVQRGRFALVGDASGTVDPLTGEGLGLAFRQAAVLAEALRNADLRRYRRAHRRISRWPRLMSRLVLQMDRSPRFRDRVLRALEAEPELFAALLDAHGRRLPLSAFGTRRAFRLGWRLLVSGRDERACR